MESSVASLMDHLNGVETRRRVVMMKRKEAETRLAFATEEQQQLDHLSAQNETREAELKKELDHFLAEQQQVQLQVMTGVDTVRQSEVEESLLIGHVRSQAERTEVSVTTWRGYTQELEELQRVWTKDDVAVPLQQRITQLDSEMAQLCTEKERLEQVVKEAMEAHALRSVGLAAAAVSGVPITQTMPVGGNVAVIQLKERLELGQRELEELRAQHARQMASVEREIADLSSRSTELAQWLTDTVASRDQVLHSTKLLHSCLIGGVCAFCRPSS